MLLKTSRPSGSWLAAMSTRPRAGHAAAVRGRTEYLGEIVQAGRRESQPVVGAVQAGAVGNRGHFDRGLGAVGEGVVHLRVEVALGHFLFRPAEEAPHRIGRRIAVARLEIHALAGSGDFEAGGACPIDQFADQCRLVAIGHGVDQALAAGLFSQDRTNHHVGLDVDHDDVLAGFDGGQRVAGAGNGMAGRLDHAVDLFAGQKRGNVVGDEGCAVLDGFAGADLAA